jgi:hypothetical protein
MSRKTDASDEGSILYLAVCPCKEDSSLNFIVYGCILSAKQKIIYPKTRG